MTRTPASNGSDSPPRKQVEREVQTATFPLLNLIQAIEQRDEDRVWALYRAARNRPQFLDWLANWCGLRVATRKEAPEASHVGTWVHVLFAIPIVSNPGDSAPAADALSSLAASIKRWFGEDHEVHLLCKPRNYTALARWSPLTQKEYLAALCGTRLAGAAPWIANLDAVDRDLPALDFLIGAVGTRSGAPEFPEGGLGPEDRLLQQEIGFAMLGRSAGELDDNVGRVAPFSDAVHSGLLLWIDALARLQIVQSWSVEPLDLDVLLLELDGVDNQCWKLPIRLHQIGLHGIDLVIERLASQLGRPRQRVGHSQ
jgi:hypothetical protein